MIAVRQEPAEPAAARAAADRFDHIVLDGIGKAFGGVEVLPRLTLTIGRGEFFVLLGPSGCGKTTTLRIIAGLEEPTEGRVLLEGDDVTRVPSARRNVNMVFQSHALFPHLTVWGNVAFGPQVSRLDRKETDARVREALEVVRLPGVQDRRPAELSGGQQQRVALARALVNRPAALLLDEPLGALDLALRRAMQRELKDIQERTNTTFVYVTHDQEEAMAMADRVAVMNGGRLEQVGTPKELYAAPASTFVASFLGASNILSGRVDQIADGRARLTLAGGQEIVAAATDASVRGTHADVLIRPERLSLRPLDPPVGRLAGTITQTTFFGHFTEHRCRIDDDVELVVHEDSLLSDRRTVGERVELHWRAEDALLLDQREGAS